MSDLATEAEARILISRDLALGDYTLGSGKTLPNICWALWPIQAIKPDTRAAIVSILKNRTKRELEVGPLAHTDALGYAIASCPTLDPERLLGKLANYTNPSPVLDGDACWNPVHCDTLVETVQIMAQCCRENNVTGRTRINDSSVEKRLLDQRRHLKAGGYDFSKESRDTTTIEHSRFSARQDSPETQNRKRLEGWRKPTLSAIAPPQRPGQSLAEAVCRRAVQDCESEPGAAAVAMLITAAILPKSLGIAKIEILNCSAVVASPTNHPTVDTYVDSDLHMPRSDRFCRFTTVGVAKSIVRHLERFRPIELRARSEEWLNNIHPTLTLSRLEQCLLFQFPVWFNTPAIYYDIGLDPNPNSIVGWRSYLTWNPETWAHRITPLLRRFDPAFSLPDNLVDLPLACRGESLGMVQFRHTAKQLRI